MTYAYMTGPKHIHIIYSVGPVMYCMAQTCYRNKSWCAYYPAQKTSCPDNRCTAQISPKENQLHNRVYNADEWNHWYYS